MTTFLQTCQLHEKQNSLFCTTCSKFICPSCEDPHIGSTLILHTPQICQISLSDQPCYKLISNYKAHFFALFNKEVALIRKYINSRFSFLLTCQYDAHKHVLKPNTLNILKSKEVIEKAIAESGNSNPLKCKTNSIMELGNSIISKLKECFFNTSLLDSRQLAKTAADANMLNNHTNRTRASCQPINISSPIMKLEFYSCTVKDHSIYNDIETARKGALKYLKYAQEKLSIMGNCYCKAHYDTVCIGGKDNADPIRIK